MNGQVQFNTRFVSSVDSTNDELKREKLQDLNSGYGICSEEQIAGRGQREKKWVSARGENLLYSFLLKNTGLSPGQQPRLLQVTALSICNMVEELTGIRPSIKWPNDIIVKNKKLAGILIENFIQSGGITSIIGSGINCNQTRFPAFEPAAISLKHITNEHYSIMQVLSAYQQCFREELAGMHDASLGKRYTRNLFGLGEIRDFETTDGEYVVAEVIGVDLLGRLVLMVDGHPRAFMNGSLKWLF